MGNVKYLFYNPLGIFIFYEILISICEISAMTKSSCLCREYWDCVAAGGNATRFCSVSDSSVCCKLRPETEDQLPCGVVESNILTNADPVRKWPWHVAVMSSLGVEYLCGGSLVEERWVLTAAHCLKTGPLVVRFPATPRNDIPVEGIVRHPGYNNITLEHDIALLKLRSSAPISRQATRPVCLPLAAPKGPCIFTGWGQINEGGERVKSLKTIEVPLWEQERCARIMRTQLGSSYRLPVTALCAGADGGRDACLGDGGGPLVCKEGDSLDENNQVWTQAGIISFGVGCGRPGVPGVYTRVHLYRPWILGAIVGHYPTPSSAKPLQILTPR